MKTQKMFLTMACILLCSAVLVAQEKPEIWSWAYHKPMKGKTAELEKAIKEKTDKFNKASVDPIYTYRVMSGARSGQLVRAIGPKDWTYYEKENEGAKHWNQYVTPLIESSSGREFYVTMKDMSYNGKGEASAKYADVSEFSVRPGHEYEFTSFVRAVTKIASENKSKARYETYRLESGGTGSKYVIIWHYETLSEKSDNSENWPEWYNKIKGSPAAWANDYETIMESLEIYGINNFLCEYLPDLSSK